MARCWMVLIALMSFEYVAGGYSNLKCNTPDWPYSCNCFDDDDHYAGDCKCRSAEWPHSCGCGKDVYSNPCQCKSAEWPRSCACNDEQRGFAGYCASTCGLPCGEVWLGDGDVWAYATPDYPTRQGSPDWAFCLCEWIIHAPTGKNLSMALDQSGFIVDYYFFVSKRGGGLDQPLSVCGAGGAWPASLCDDVVASGSLHVGLYADVYAFSLNVTTTEEAASEPLNATVLHDLPDNGKDMMDCQCSDKDIQLNVEQKAAVESPGFPNQIPINCNCYWCYGDSCEPFNSTSNRLALVFVSDSYGTDKGFSLTITTTDCTACDVEHVTCQHGGTCTPDGADVHCHCLPGYTGPLFPTDCLTLHCDNGGTCIEPSKGEVKCICAVDLTGQLCGERITTPGPSTSLATTSTTTSVPSTATLAATSFASASSSSHSSTASSTHSRASLSTEHAAPSSQSSSTHSASLTNTFSPTASATSKSASTDQATSTSVSTEPGTTESGTNKSTSLVLWLSCAGGGLLALLAASLTAFCIRKRCARQRKPTSPRPEIQIFTLPPPPSIPLPSIPSTPESSRREEAASFGTDSGYAGIGDSASIGSGIYETCDYATMDESAPTTTEESMVDTTDHEKEGLPKASKTSLQDPTQPKDTGYDSASVVPAAYTEASSAPYSMASTVGGTEGDTGLGSDLTETEYGYASMDAAKALPLVKLGALPPPPNRPIPPTPTSVRSNGPKPGYADCISLKLGTPSEFADYLARRSVATPSDVYSSLSDVSTLGPSEASFGTEYGTATEGTDDYATTTDGHDSDGTLQGDEGEYNVSRF